MWRTNYYLSCILCCLLVGCRSEPERLAVSGSVSLDGKAIGSCTLIFQPLAGAETSTGATAIVSDGRFAISKSNGLIAGEYGVVFTEFQPDLEDYEAARRSGAKQILTKKFIPSKYTRPNELRVRVASERTPISLELKSRSR